MGFFNRQEAKWKARMAMRGAYPHPMLVTLVYLLLGTGVSALIMRFVANPFDLAYAYMLDGRYELADIYRYVFTPGRTALYGIVQLLLSLYGIVVSFGYTSYSLRLARGEQPNYRNLLDGFATAGRVLEAGIFVGIFTFLWALLGAVPYIVVLILSIVMESYGMMFLAAILAFFMLFMVVIASLRYQLTYFFLLDNPEMKPLEAIRHSKEAMRGWLGAAFMLDLSFFGWLLLVPFTFGILSLWLTPYQRAAQANFYDFVVHGTCGPQTDASGQPGGYQSNYGGGYQGPDDPF